MKLELKHIAPYLPYGLIAADEYGRKRKVVLSHFTYDTQTVSICNLIDLGFRMTEHKPILRPMSIIELTNYFLLLFDEDINVRTFLNDEFLESHGIDFEKILDFKIEWLPFGVVDLFLKHHFDVFGLIPQGLAIDINTLKSENQ